MGIFDRGQGRERREQQQQQAELDKANLPDGNREDVRRPKPMDMRKGSEVIHDPNFGKRPNDHGRDAPLDPMRQAKPEMMAVVSVMIPELSNSKSPQASGLLKQFENPAVLRSYLINPDQTAHYLGQRFPEMKDVLLKNRPFVKEGNHLTENPESGLYQRIRQEVSLGVNPKQSFVQQHMDGLLTSAIPASLGGSMGMETKAYELLRNRIENPNFNSEGAQIEQKISRLMTSPQAREDLKEVVGIARQKAITPSTERSTRPQPSQAQGVPTTTGQQVQGPLRQVSQPAPGAIQQPHMSTPPPPTELPHMVPQAEARKAGAPTPQSTPTPVPSKPGEGIVVPELKPAGVPTTNGTTVTGPLQPVAPSTPTAPRPPLMSAMNPQIAVPVLGGGAVSGELKIVPPPSAAIPGAPSTPELKTTAAPDQQPATAPEQKPSTAPEQKPATPLPDQLLKAQNQQMEATIAKLEDTLKKATDTTEAMMKKLQESEARNADLMKKLQESEARNAVLMKRLEESERRAQRMELKSDVNDILREQKQNIANGKELDQAITAITKPEQKDLPTAEQVATKVTELREQAKQKEIQAQKEIVKKINESFATLPANPGVTQTRDWTTKNMELHNSLDDKGKKAFVNYIKNNYQFQQDQETFDPMSFFNRKIADAAAQEIVNATRSKEVYIPSGASIPNGMPPTMTTFQVPDPVRIAEILRSVSDLKDVLPHIQANEEVQAVRNKLPKSGFFGTENGIYQKAFDARLTGNKTEAEALFLRSLIEAGDLADPAQRQKVIREALGSDKAQSDQIREHYKKTFDTDLLADLKKANARQLAERESADAEVKKQEEALQKARDKAKAAAAKVEDLL